MRQNIAAHFFLVAALFFLVAIVGLAWFNSSQTPSLEQFSEMPMNPDDIIRATGLQTFSYRGEKIESSISCEELSAIPRKFGIFKLNSAYEMTMKNVVVEFFLPEGRPSKTFKPFAVTSSLDGVIGELDQLGSLLKRTIEPIELKFHQAEHLSLTVTANKATIDPRTGKTKLENLKLEHVPTKRKVVAQSAVWNNTSYSFTIPGNYLLEAPQSTKVGRGIDVRLDFKLTRH